MPRAYTKSGDKEVYESDKWKSPIYTGLSSINTISVDSNGNYNWPIIFNFQKTNSSTSYYITTNYADITLTQYYEYKLVDNTKTLDVYIYYNSNGSNNQGRNSGYYIQEVSYYEKTDDFMVPDNRTSLFSSGEFTEQKSTSITINKGKIYTLYCWVYICMNSTGIGIGPTNTQTTLTVSNGKILGSSSKDDYEITYDFDSSAIKLIITVDCWHSGSSGGGFQPSRP